MAKLNKRQRKKAIVTKQRQTLQRYGLSKKQARQQLSGQGYVTRDMTLQFRQELKFGSRSKLLAELKSYVDYLSSIDIVAHIDDVVKKSLQPLKENFPTVYFDGYKDLFTYKDLKEIVTVILESKEQYLDSYKFASNYEKAKWVAMYGAPEEEVTEEMMSSMGYMTPGTLRQDFINTMEAAFEGARNATGFRKIFLGEWRQAVYNTFEDSRNSYSSKYHEFVTGKPENIFSGEELYNAIGL